MKGFKNELVNNILSFWTSKMVDVENGGFYGAIDGQNLLDKRANKGVVLNARLLWTFSAAYRILKTPIYLEMATRAYNYLVNSFIDTKHGGVFWELDYLGKPVNTKKQVYAQGFALYGFTEYYRATKSSDALNWAKQFFNWIEKCKDRQSGGYFEAYTQDWQEIDDMRLSDKDANEKKTMNTHLHILEPYTNLLRVWNDEELRNAQSNLISIFISKILNKENYHLHLFFNESWKVKSSAISYGHDIEAAWLLYEATEVLADSEMMKKIVPISLKIVEAASRGYLPDGSLIYERNGEHFDNERHWWVQAEAVVGCMYAYKLSQSEKYKQQAQRVWQYIQNNIVDKEHGEWHWSRYDDGTINTKDDKAGFWKCPYHNGRMCMEMIENFGLE